MAVYQSTTGANSIGTLLRMIQEKKSETPIVPIAAEASAPMREMVDQPVYGAESPGTNRVVSLRPEAPVSTDTSLGQNIAPTRASVGPAAIGGTEIQMPGVPAATPEGVAPTPTQAEIEASRQPVPSFPSGGDINPNTGHKFAENPAQGWTWDDNYYQNVVLPTLKSGGQVGAETQAPVQEEAPQEEAPQPQVLGTQIKATPTPAQIVGGITERNQQFLNEFSKPGAVGTYINGTPNPKPTPTPMPTPLYRKSYTEPSQQKSYKSTIVINGRRMNYDPASGQYVPE